MSLFRIFDVAGSALSAQSVRLNTVSSNLANAESAATRPADAYKARHPVFQTMVMGFYDDRTSAGVQVGRIVEDQNPPRQMYEPGHPLADEQGYIYMPNINAVEEMANMISASRSYQSNVEVINTSKQMLMRTLSLGQ